MELANTRLTIMRGTAANAYGDLTDVGTPIYSGVPAAVVESSKVVLDPATQQPRTIRTSTAVVAGWVDVLNSDTIKDESTGNYYMIQDITLQPTGPTGITPEKLLTLRWRSGVTTASDNPAGERP
jgi:hypothetical protein